ncbi:uncharacterized protein VTP21DRAFT_4641 [Calcarisporiella thermophila]|uniref:uncharacterized protein n=1 Tax=Calcarisporiella thermophila TaxID=911321 RepID=UPI0037426344
MPRLENPNAYRNCREVTEYSNKPALDFDLDEDGHWVDDDPAMNQLQVEFQRKSKCRIARPKKEVKRKQVRFPLAKPAHKPRDDSLIPRLVRKRPFCGLYMKDWPAYEFRRDDNFVVTTDPGQVQFHRLNEFLQKQAYWSTGRSAETILRAAENSVNLSLMEVVSENPTEDSGYSEDDTGSASPLLEPMGEYRQIGYARIITDFATFAYVADVFLLPQYRGRGLGGWMIECALAIPEVQGLKRWCLRTQFKKQFYARYGFADAKNADHLMEYYPVDGTN